MTFYFANINTGAVPNDGTGDPLRTAFIKTNNNFDTISSNVGNAEIYCLSINSSYISTFNQIEAATLLAGTITVNTVVANTYIGNISVNSSTFTDITVSNTATISKLVASGGSINGASIGDTSPNTGVFTSLTASSISTNTGGNINANSGNILSVRNIFPSVNSFGTNLNANGSFASFNMSAVGTGQYLSYDIQNNTNVTITFSGVITAGAFKDFYVRNTGVSGNANVILSIPGNNTNKGSNVAVIPAGKTTYIKLMAFGTNSNVISAMIVNS